MQVASDHRARTGAPAGWVRWRLALVLGLVVVLAGYLRLRGLVPMNVGLLYPQDYDEAVWGTTAQLMLQGYLPYRDFFATLPPLGIYLFAVALRVVYVPWGSGIGFMAMRYASVLSGLLSLGAIYRVGRKLAGRWTGIAAAAILALDGMAVAMDRRVMLEPSLNLFSILAVGTYLHVAEATDRRVCRRGIALAAGALSAMAALAKTPGMVVILALLTVSLLRRRWTEAILLVIGFGVSWLVICAPFLLRCPGDLLRQAYFFQLLRPPDGMLRRTTRLLDIWRNDRAWLTVRMGALGTAWTLAWVGLRRRTHLWWAILAWLGYAVALLLVNGSYWSQYYVQLVPPLSLLAGSLIGAPEVHPRGSRRWATALGLVAASLVLGVGLVGGGAIAQTRATLKEIGQKSTAYTEIAEYLAQNTEPDTSILTFEPNYTFLSSRRLVGSAPGRWLVDSYGEMLYLNLGIGNMSVQELTAAVATGKRSSLQETFWRAPAQRQIEMAFERAEYVIVDGRARYQVQPPLLSRLEARSVEVLAAGVASLRAVERPEP